MITSVSMLLAQYCTLTFDTNYESADHCAVRESSLQKNAPLSSICNAFKKFFQSTVMSWGEQINWAERKECKGWGSWSTKAQSSHCPLPSLRMGWVADIKVWWHTQSATIQRSSPVSQSDTFEISSDCPTVYTTESIPKLKCTVWSIVPPYITFVILRRVWGPKRSWGKRQLI